MIVYEPVYTPCNPAFALPRTPRHHDLFTSHILARVPSFPVSVVTGLAASRWDEGGAFR